MKQMYIYLLLLFGLAFCVSCSNDDELQDINCIIKSNLLFEAQGGEGFIELSDERFTAKSDKEWCQVRTEGRRVEVSCPQNIETSERTALITINMLDKQVSVPVTQAAPVFQISSTAALDFFGNDEVKEVKVLSSLQVTVTPADDWLKYELLDDGTVRFSCVKSDVPLRSTTVCISAGKMKVELECSQMCIEGEYIFTYTNVDWDDIDLPATLVKDIGETNIYTLKAEGMPFGRDLKLKWENNKLAFHAGQYLGTEAVGGEEKHLFLTLGYGQITPTWNPVVDYVAPMEQNKSGEFFFEFIDNKHWDGGKFFVIRLSFSTFSSAVPDSDSFEEEVEKLAYVIMTVKRIF